MAAGMQQQQPNIYFVNSSFERQGQPPYRYPAYDPYCVTPGSAFSMPPAAGQKARRQSPASRSQSRQGGAQGRASSESKKLARVGKHQRPETFYINTITNNYYQVKKRNALLARQAEANKMKNEVSSQPALTQGNGEDRLASRSSYRAGAGTGAESAVRAASGTSNSGNGANPASPFQGGANFGYGAYGYNPHHQAQHPSAHHHPGMHPQHHQMPPHPPQFGPGQSNSSHNHGQSPYMNGLPPMCTCAHSGARLPTPFGMPYGYPGAPGGYPESPYGAPPMAGYPGYMASMGQYPGAPPMHHMPMYGGMLPHDFSHHHGDGQHDEQDELEDSQLLGGVGDPEN